MFWSATTAPSASLELHTWRNSYVRNFHGNITTTFSLLLLRLGKSTCENSIRQVDSSSASRTQPSITIPPQPFSDAREPRFPPTRAQRIEPFPATTKTLPLPSSSNAKTDKGIIVFKIYRNYFPVDRLFTPIVDKRPNSCYGFLCCRKDQRLVSSAVLPKEFINFSFGLPIQALTF